MEIQILDKGHVKLLSHMGDDATPLSDARLSSQAVADPKRDDKLREYLWEHQHSSTFQGMICQIELKLPLFVLHQLHRHRTVGFDGLEISSSEEGFRRWFSPNEQSGRYSQFEEEFYVPSKVLAQDTKNKQGSVDSLSIETQALFMTELTTHNEYGYELYNRYIKHGVSKEHARLCLESNIYTRRRITGDFVNWCNLLRLRLDPHAQPESRAYAEAIAKILESLWPKSYLLFEEHTLHSIKFSRTEMDCIKEMAEYYKLPQVSGWVERLGKKRFEELCRKIGVQ